MSRCLSDLRIEHVVLERGRVAERWRSERWDSLRLLTPNWMTRLPGFQYDGPDPDGFMTAREVAAFFERYARSFAAPVETDTTVDAIEFDPSGDGFLVTTTAACGTRATSCWPPGIRIVRSCRRWHGASTPASIRSSRASTAIPPRCPTVASSWSARRRREFSWPTRFRPAAARSCCPPGSTSACPGVIADGTSCGGSIAPEFWTRPRNRSTTWNCRGTRLRSSSSGRPDHATLDLERLRRAGVLVVGRLMDIDGHRLRFDDDLVKTTVAADVKLASLLSRLDRARREHRAWRTRWRARAIRAAVARVCQRADGASPEGGRHRHRGLGHGLPPRLFLAEAAAARRAGRAAAITAASHRARASTRSDCRSSGRASRAFIDGVGADARVLARHVAVRVGSVGDAQRAAAATAS